MAKSPVRNDFTRILDGMTGRYQSWQIWADFVQMAAISISNAIPWNVEREKREELYLSLSGKYDEKELGAFPKLLDCVICALEQDPYQDYLGSLYMQLDLGSHWHGQFFTPFRLCEAMARITLDGLPERIEEKGWVSLCDPACGAGATLIAGAKAALDIMPDRNWQNHLLFVAQDIDPIVASMCYIQLSLIGAAGYIKVGNTLTDPMCTNDPHPENYWYTPMYFNDVWAARRLWHRVDAMCRRETPTETTTVTRTERVTLTVAEPPPPKSITVPPVRVDPTKSTYEQLSMF